MKTQTVSGIFAFVGAPSSVPLQLFVALVGAPAPPSLPRVVMAAVTYYSRRFLSVSNCL
jgi:hypothetical protein